MVLSWSDARLSFHDLNELSGDKNMNVMEEEEMLKIWSPKVSFDNALGK